MTTATEQGRATLSLSTEQVWNAIDEASFLVMSYLTPVSQEASRR